MQRSFRFVVFSLVILLVLLVSYQHIFTPPNFFCEPAHVVTPPVSLQCTSTNEEYTLHKLDFSVITEHVLEKRKRDINLFLNTSVDFHSFSQVSMLHRKAYRRKMQGRGIVTFITNETSSLDYLRINIRFLRKTGCTLPIEVFAFSNELTDENRDRIKSFSTKSHPITLREVDDPRNPLPVFKSIHDKHGYHVKIGGIINSSFEHVISLDSDILMFSNPEKLFDMVAYKKNGAIFYPDFWKTHSENPIWRLLDISCVDEFEMESGLMVINKKKAWRALMLVKFWNLDLDSRLFIETFLHGDKDQFRFAWKKTGTPYFMVQNLMSLGGFMHEDKFCGLSIMQKDPIDPDRILFAHINHVKHSDFPPSEFNFSHPILSSVKDFTPLTKAVDLHDHYSCTGCQLAFSNWKNIVTVLTEVPGHYCVDFTEEGGRTTEIVPFDTTLASEIMKEYLDRKEWGV